MDEIMRDIGFRCMTLRKRNGLSQIEFAEAAGVSRESVIRFEAGRSNSLKLYLFYQKLDGGDLDGKVGKY